MTFIFLICFLDLLLKLSDLSGWMIQEEPEREQMDCQKIFQGTMPMARLAGRLAFENAV